ncbi:hypothetical protein HMPREF9444_01809 [Succinatimonas hippei YIT 12066]|uniref:Uncharacterized protein n=1 Tax=Succinatimonas hippei (strain DSM 22608 / JCM 16073 / KCTC 15190 / YIT 12066) TaxID=762983 RepID=E8LM35_SUCHY|nr:hypothetical protein HMPREF9444_01809 [Succinatimonas hippei YIT 12066]
MVYAQIFLFHQLALQTQSLSGQYHAAPYLLCSVKYIQHIIYYRLQITNKDND